MIAIFRTPEMKEFLEQLSTLGIRLLDAASSGKAKQLMQDTKDLTWKGIEMATDPATTLALAEVTAHLCHALEDTQNALNPTPRRNRNAQNQNIYLNPFQMADFPEQVTMEEVILSCLGRVDDHGTEAVGDDVASLPSRLTLDDDLSLTEPDYRDWKERKERVNVHLLREKILIEGLAGSGTEKATRPVVDVQQEKSRNEEAKVGVGVEDAGGFRIEQSRTTTNHTQDEDMEDISLSCVPGRRRLGLMDGDKRTVSSEGLPAVQQFYQRLDELLEQNRYRQGSIRPRLETTINNSLVTGENEYTSPGVWKAKMTKMHQKQRSTEVHRNARNPNISRMSKNYQVLMIAILAMVTMLFVAFSFFTVYGIYSVMCGRSNNAPSTNQEIIIRIVREIVHVTEDGKIIGDSGPRALSQEELDKVGQKIESLFR